MKGIRIFTVMAMLMLCVQGSRAGTGFTIVRDKWVFNQFQVMEMGGNFNGSYSDWLKSLHHSYYKKVSAASATGLWSKNTWRMMEYVEVWKQAEYSDTVKSKLENRAVKEGEKFISRSVDLESVFEKSKYSGKYHEYAKLLNKLRTVVGSHNNEYDYWKGQLDIFRMQEDAIHNAYMPQGDRKEAYQRLYNDIIASIDGIKERIEYFKAIQLLGREESAGVIHRSGAYTAAWDCLRRMRSNADKINEGYIMQHEDWKWLLDRNSTIF